MRSFRWFWIAQWPTLLGTWMQVVALGYLVFLAMGLAISGWIRDGQRATVIAQSIAFAYAPGPEPQ